MMMRFQAKRSKTTQYAIGAVVGIIIVALWISIPLMSGSSSDASVSAGNPFHSQVADISVLGSDIPSEGGAPGSPLSGEMINNPATSGEEIASSLFQSGADEEAPLAEPSADAGAAPSAAPSSAPGIPSPSGSGSGAKLSMAASLSGGNSNSMTAGGVHNKFFGGGNQKAELAPISGADIKKMASADKPGGLVAMLGAANEKSQLAARTGSMDAAKGGASEAFGGAAKPGAADLNGKLEDQAAVSGLELGEVAADLKKSDPSISKKKVKLPEPKAEKDDKASDEMKQMIIQMIISAVLKVALGGLGLG